MGISQPSKCRSVTAVLVVLLALSMVVRYVYWQKYTLPTTARDWPTDYRGYQEGARELLAHGWPDPNVSEVFRNWPPLFPLYIAAGYKLFGPDTHTLFCWLGLVGSTGVVLLVYVLARRWGFGPWWAMIGAAAMAFNPALVFHAGYVLSDIPFTLAVLATALAMVAYLDRPGYGRLVLMALAAGVCLYLRFAGMVVVGALGCLLIARIILRQRDGVRHLVAYMAVSIALLIPLRLMTGFPNMEIVARGATTNRVYTGDNPLAFWEVYSSDSGRLTDTIHVYQAVYYSGFFVLAVIGLAGRWGLKELGAVGIIMATYLLCTPWTTGAAPYFRYRMPIEPLVLMFVLRGLRTLWWPWSRRRAVDVAIAQTDA